MQISSTILPYIFTDNTAGTDQHVSFGRVCSHPYPMVACVEIDRLKNDNRLTKQHQSQHE